MAEKMVPVVEVRVQLYLRANLIPGYRVPEVDGEHWDSNQDALYSYIGEVIDSLEAAHDWYMEDHEDTVQTVYVDDPSPDPVETALKLLEKLDGK